ncbi:hypothetical protein DH2020_021898 [Rehmannia glutinosa]|uniref:Uncharacterized protein n=1 Tax=Rehmannia glutinosa TaxID=99300 RepID=A0ABR0WC71_REHGL
MGEGSVLELGTELVGPQVCFGAGDLRGVHVLHNDALVITANMANFEVARAMVDTRSSINILFYDAYLKMDLEMDLKPVETALFGFGGGMVEPVGKVMLPISLGTYPLQKTRMVTFLVVDSYSAYNAIIGRPALNSFQAIVSTYHMKLKFVVGDKEGEVLGDVQAARKCYVEAVKKEEQKKSKRKMVELERETKPERVPDLLSVRPEEELMSVELVPRDAGKVTRVGTQLSSELTSEIICFLRKNTDVFAWTARDLQGVDPDQVTHHLNVDKEKRSVKEKRPLGAVKDKILEQIPREENIKADHLAKIASSASSCNTRKITVISESSSSIEVEVWEIEERDDWRYGIYQYLSKSHLPEDKWKASRIRARATRFCIIGDLLYKRAFAGPMLRCLSEEEGSYVLREIHEGACGAHGGSRSLAKRVSRAGYF